MSAIYDDEKKAKYGVRDAFREPVGGHLNQMNLG